MYVHLCLVIDHSQSLCEVSELVGLPTMYVQDKVLQWSELIRVSNEGMDV